MIFYPEILNTRQKKVLACLEFLKAFPFYLAGGTALALQLNHRTSLDFDFYSTDKFDSQKVFRTFKKHCPVVSSSKEQLENTWQGTLFGINISLFYYPYKLINPLVNFSFLKLAPLEDIAAMKIVAIVQRARQRDFFDLYCLMKKMGLKKIITAAFQKYPWYEENSQIVLKALTFFEEADKDNEIKNITIFDTKLNWKKVKQEIAKQVEQFDIASIPQIT